MLLSRNWLKEFVDIPDTLSAAELGRLLTLHTVEVEGWHDLGAELKSVVVGEIKKIKKHPDADTLHIAEVDVGKGKPLQIVFGSMVTLHVGEKVPVAVAPARLPGGREIKKTKLRGVESQGMLCVEQELGLKKDGVDIHYFDKKTKNGTPVAAARGLNDVVYEIDNKSLTHRPDLWGVYGLAREVAAILSHPLKPYPFKKIKSMSAAPNQIKVAVEEKRLCPRYMGFMMEGVKVGPSPAWLAERLNAVGIRPINNVVDLTNYMMYELGQPLHAFDAACVAGNKLVVRRASPGEKITTLDGVERTLQPEMLVIADEKNPVALAGIMGGEGSGVTEKTTSLFLEAANFDAVAVRRASMALGLRTESSMRFEKSLDAHLPEVALSRFVALAGECLKGAEPAGKVIDVNHETHTSIAIALPWQFLEAQIGTALSEERVKDILHALGFETHERRGELLVSVPSWRATGDITIPEDLVEEIARIHGFDNIPPCLPCAALKGPLSNPVRALEKQCKELWAEHLRWSEVYNYSFVNQSLIEKIGDDPARYIALKNPLSLECTHLRRNFLPRLLLNVEKNMHEFDEVKLFETGLVFLGDLGGMRAQTGKEELLPAQTKRAGGAVWKRGDEAPVAAVKELVAYTFAELGVEWQAGESRVPPWAHPGRAADVIVKGQVVGFVSEVHPEVCARFGIEGRVATWNINLEALAEVSPPHRPYTRLPQFPPVKRDISMSFPECTPFQEVRATILKHHPALVGAELFDAFYKRGEKSFAFHLTFLDQARTLTGEEIETIFKSLAAALEKKFKGRLRS